MSLSNYQLVLLDNLIYLGKFEKLANNVKEEVNVGEVIDDLLNGNEISHYWRNELAEAKSKDSDDEKSKEELGQGMMTEKELCYIS